MHTVELATVLLGARAFNENNVNDTYRGQVLTAGNETPHAIIKDLDLLQLCNELLAYCLAKEVELPIPQCYIGLVRPGVLETRKAPKANDGSSLVFVSIDVKVPNVTYRLSGANFSDSKALLDKIANWSRLGDLYAFDTWIANVDRHTGNLLFGAKNEAWLIDHGHCFTGPAWRKEHLDPDASYRNRLSEWLTQLLTPEQKKSRAKEISNFSSVLGNFDATASSKNSGVDGLLPSERILALKKFLEKRTANIPAKASEALGVPILL